MLYINTEYYRFKKAKYTFIKKMKTLVTARLDKYVKDSLTDSRDKKFFKIVRNRLADILIADPKAIAGISSHLNPFVFAEDTEEEPNNISRGVSYIFNYEWFSSKCKKRYDAYSLASDLSVNTCPYCNRNYTNTIITKNKEKLCRPAFDHYFAQSNHPLLAISFYNLIPSCTTCNSGRKGDAKMSLETHLHPYITENVDNITFSYRYSFQTESGLEIITKSLSEREKETLRLFGINEVYNSHIDELRDMIRMRSYFTDNYLNILKSSLLGGILMSKKELYRLAFGTEFLLEDFINKPLSKFKSDILIELGIIE